MKHLLRRLLGRGSVPPSSTPTAPPTNVASSSSPNPPPQPVAAANRSPTIFFSHRQADAGDRCQAMLLDLQPRGIDGWFDMKVESITLDSMKLGVKDCAVYVLFLSTAVVESFCVQLELATALRAGKPLALVVDQDADVKSPLHIANIPALFHQLVERMNASSELRVPGATDTETMLLSKFGDVINFYRRGPHREEMLRTIVGRAGLVLGAATSPQINKDAAEILLVGHSQTGEDQCCVIELELLARGVAAATLSKEDDVAHFVQGPRVCAVLVYMTDQVLTQPHVVATLHAAQQRRGCRIVMVFEGDWRRAGAVLGQDRSWDAARLKQQALQSGNTDLAHLFDTIEAIEFSKATRSKAYLESTINMILSSAGLSPITIPFGFDPFRVPTNKCRELEQGTRRWVFNDISAHFKESTSALLLVGQAGMGKSVISASLARRGHPFLSERVGGRQFGEDDTVNIGALHFFEHGDPYASSFEVCIRSVARQLCMSVPGFRSLLPQSKESLEDLINMSAKLGPEILLETLVIRPASSLNLAPETTRKIIILLDSLDECAQSDALSRAIARKWSAAPKWLLLLATTRPIDSIIKPLTMFKHMNLTPADARNADDLRVFLRNRVERAWHVENASNIIESAVRKSEGVFMWLSFLEQKMEKLAFDGKLTLAAIDELPAGLEHVYAEYFTRLFSALGNEEQRYQDVVATALLVPRAPVPEALWMSSLGYQNSRLEERRRYAKEIRDPASSLLIFQDGQIVPPHKSMIDWLCGIGDRCAEQMGLHDLAVEASQKHHRMLAQCLEDTYMAMTVKPWGNADALTQHERFAIAHGAYHWSRGGDDARAREWYTNFQRLYWRIGDAVAEGGRVGVEHVIHEATSLGDLSFVVDLVRLASDALLHDVGELAGQVMGRLPPAPQRSKAQDGWYMQAESWVSRATTEGGLRITIPCGVFSGLALPGGAAKTIFTAHVAPVTAVAFVGDGKRIVTGAGEGNTAILWELESGAPLRTLAGHTQIVSAIATSPVDENRAVTGSHDCTCRLWDLGTGATILTMNGHKDLINVVAYSSDGRLAISGSEDNTARLWDVSTGTETLMLESHEGGVTSVAISADGRYALTGSRDESAKLWNVATHDVLAVLPHTGEVTAVAFGADSRIFTASEDRTVQVWDLSTHARLHTFEHPWSVTAMAVSGERLLTGAQDKVIRLWNLTSNVMENSFHGHSSYISALAFSPNPSEALSGSLDKTAVHWDLSSQICSFRPVDGHRDKVTCVAVVGTTKTVLSGSWDKTARLWRVDTGELVGILTGHKGYILSIDISHDGKYALTCSSDRTACVWELQTMKGVNVLNGHTDSVVAGILSRDMSSCVTGSWDKTARIWDVKTGAVQTVLVGHTDTIRSVALADARSPRQAVTNANDGQTRLWNAETGEGIRVLDFVAPSVRCVVLSRTGQYLIAGTDKYTVRVWDVDAGKEETGVVDAWSLDTNGQIPLAVVTKHVAGPRSSVGFTLDAHPKFRGMVNKDSGYGAFPMDDLFGVWQWKGGASSS